MFKTGKTPVQVLSYRQYESWMRSLGSGNGALAQVTGVAKALRDSQGNIDPNGFVGFAGRGDSLGPQHLDLQGMQRLLLTGLAAINPTAPDVKDVSFDCIVSVRYLKGPLANRDSGWTTPEEVDEALGLREVGIEAHLDLPAA